MAVPIFPFIPLLTPLECCCAFPTCFLWFWGTVRLFFFSPLQLEANSGSHHPTSEFEEAPSVGKESACSAGDMGSIPGSGRPPGEGKGNPLQYSCLENSMNRGTWWAAVHGVARVGHNRVTKQPPLIPLWPFVLVPFIWG